MRTAKWKQCLLRGLCALSLAGTVACNQKSDPAVHNAPPSGAHVTTGDSDKVMASPTKPKPAADTREDSGPLGVHPPESTPPAASRGGSGTGTPTGPGSALPSGTSGETSAH